MAAWSTSLLMTRLPLIHRRTPSSLVVWNVYAPLLLGLTWPVQRTENESAPIDDDGALLPQLKFTCASTRVNFRLVKSLLSKYCAVRPFASNWRDSSDSKNILRLIRIEST